LFPIIKSNLGQGKERRRIQHCPPDSQVEPELYLQDYTGYQTQIYPDLAVYNTIN